MWEERYKNADDYVFGRAPSQFLTENPGWFTPGQAALCVADGEGRNSVYMAKCGLDVTAFDLSETAVARGNALAASEGVSVSFNHSTWDDWDFSTQYDLVAGIFIQYTNPEQRVHQFNDMKRAVKPGGVLMLHGYTPEQVALGTGGPPNAAHMYTVEMLSTFFADFRILRLAAYERDVQEGRGHSGKSALIDLVARAPE